MARTSSPCVTNTTRLDMTSGTAPRPRIIERWFPCAEVSRASGQGWGSSNSECNIFMWFAKRPLAQARAAALTSLLPWPDDPDDQERVKAVISESLGACQDPGWPGDSTPHAFGIKDCARFDKRDGYDAARSDVLRLLKQHYPDGATTLDPFSGRGLLPLESARYGVDAYAIDYSPVATLAGRLLVDYPFRNWDDEPDLPFDSYDRTAWIGGRVARLVHDIEFLHGHIQREWADSLHAFYPDNAYGETPWGYLWAATIPCDECGRWFPLFGSNVLRKATATDEGQSVEITCSSTSWSTSVIKGVTGQPPTLRVLPGTKRNKLAWCPYPNCGHAHPIKTHQRLSTQHFGRDEIIAVADLIDNKKVFRDPNEEEREAVGGAAAALAEVKIGVLPGKPNEQIAPGNAHSVGGLLYGAVTYGDLSNDRQNLAHARLCQLIGSAAEAIEKAGCSPDYAAALAGYMTAVLSKKLRASTRGARLQVMGTGGNKVGDVFVDEAGVGYNYDYFETATGFGPGTWSSVIRTTPIERQCEAKGRPATVRRGSALSLPFADDSMDAVITDPPYGDMIEYADSSDFFYTWIKRAVAYTNPELSITANPMGTQEKDEELIVLRMASGLNDHRTEEFYETNISKAFAEACRVVKKDGVVTIVFGHGDPDVWKILLTAIDKAGLVLTGAWPAQTEQGGSAGSSNIVTTLTLACRPAPPNRPNGRVAEVDAEVRRLVRERVQTVWEPAGLAYADQKMAAAGPAMEVVGRYKKVLDKVGREVDINRYLPLARRAVTETHDLRFDQLPLGTFDSKTQFALEWVRTHGRDVLDASEARWQRLAADLDESETIGVLQHVKKGLRFAYANESESEVAEGSPIIDVAFAAAAAWHSGSLTDAAATIGSSSRDPDDQHLWACILALGKSLPESDKDGMVWTQMVRLRSNLVAASRTGARLAAEADQMTEAERRIVADSPRLFEDPNSLFGQEGPDR
jgi:putative DNA methylase